MKYANVNVLEEKEEIVSQLSRRLQRRKYEKRMFRERKAWKAAKLLFSVVVAYVVSIYFVFFLLELL